jgi:hypothetical protein
MNKPILIGLLAKKRHGKDTLADYLVNRYGFNKDALAEPLKNVCKELFLLSDEQMYGDLKEIVDTRYGVSPRQIFQFIGTDLLRKQMGNLIPSLKDNLWINLLQIRYTNALKSNPAVRFVVADIRMENEADMIKELNGIIIKIDRPSKKDVDEHFSEQIDKVKNYDYLISNEGTIEEYYIKIDTIMKDLGIV